MLKLKCVQRTALKAVPFADLLVGEVYDSGSRYGLCLKTSDSTFWSFITGYLESTSSNSQWQCLRVDAQLNWRLK